MIPVIFLRTAVWVLFGILVCAFGAVTPVRDSVAVPTKVAVLDFVDLNDNQIKTEPSEWLRRSVAATGKFKVLPRDTMAKRLTEFNVNLNQPCNNPQCSFDIGSYLQADFVLYGSYSPLPQADVVTLKLLYIPKAQIAWTWVGEVQMAAAGGDKGLVWERQFAAIANSILDGSLVLEKPKVHKTLAVVDLSDLSFLSRVFFERIQTRISGFPQYDPLSQSELSELFTALEINKYSVAPSLENMVGLGQKLGVSNLIYSRIYRDGKSYLCRLAMYDIERKAAVLELPPQPSEDFGKLLEYERIFFFTLAAKEKNRAAAPAIAQQKGKSYKALWVSLGLLGVGGGLGLVWVDKLKKGGGGGTGPTQFPDPNPPPGDPTK